MSLFTAIMRRITALEKAVKQLRPASAPGIRTTRTSRGVMRRAIAQPAARPGPTTKGVIVTFL